MADKDRSFFDKPRNIQFILYGLYGSCALLFGLDFFIHRHFSHPWEGLLGFYAVYGFVGCVLLVLISKWMRLFLMRDEAYYDSKKSDSGGAEGEGSHVAE